MNKFSEIEQFRHAVKSVEYMFPYTKNLPTLTYTGTVKLHGTNSGIDRVNGVFKPQSRNNIISVGCDNAGFAKFVSEIDESLLVELFNKVSSDPNDNVTLYGEFIGKGIQKAVAIGELDKQWVIFSAKLNGEYIDIDPSWNIESASVFNILRIEPFHVTIDFTNPREAIPELERLTLQVEEECPWAKQFGVSGVGEGIVWKCDQNKDHHLWFKTKGLKHKNNKDKKSHREITADPQRVANETACVDAVLPEWRLEQGFDHLRENNLDIAIENLGTYLQWINKDVRKEEMDTITANGFEWKDIAKAINSRAKSFFLEKANTF